MPIHNPVQATFTEATTLKRIAESKGMVLHYIFPDLSQQTKLIHSVFTRHGGVSKKPYHYLNIGFNTGDNPDHVSENLDIIKKNILQTL